MQRQRAVGRIGIIRDLTDTCFIFQIVGIIVFAPCAQTVVQDQAFISLGKLRVVFYTIQERFDRVYTGVVFHAVGRGSIR